MTRSVFLLILTMMLCACSEGGSTLHVAPDGDDSYPGTPGKPFKTISAAALTAQPGDVIMIHGGVYREQVNPPRGGLSAEKRITYRSADGETAVIKGSEQWTDWTPVQGDTWLAVIPNHFFGKYNPYRDEIAGDWFNGLGRVHHTGAVYLNGHWLTETAVIDSVLSPDPETPYWFCQADSATDGVTRIWAQFQGVNPNEELVEIHVRQSAFYPEKTGINYLTVSGLTLEHAATNWAPPTAEQIGLIGTNWSKGWMIEDNVIRYSTCVGLTLGKHGDAFDNTSANSAEGYVKTIERGTAAGWSKDNIGHHVVRNNQISHCEQAGIVGSLGAVFSDIYGNVIHDIHVRRLFTGAEMAGIKLHGAVDSRIFNNHIYRCNRGIWLDWMAQGARVYKNLLHDNGPSEDLFMEVNHGPALIDHNFFLSPHALLINSQGEAFAHNLIAGRIYVITGEKRLTPYLEAHSTVVAGLAANASGDARFYNNIFLGAAGTDGYDQTVLPVYMDGNVYLNGARQAQAESSPLMIDEAFFTFRLEQQDGKWMLEWPADPEWAGLQPRRIITSDLLGLAAVPELPFVMPDGSDYVLDTDYLGQKIRDGAVFAGPVQPSESPQTVIVVWPPADDL